MPTMTDNIVERLRDYNVTYEDCIEAANEIERLTTELRAAATIAKRLSEAADEIEKLRAAPVSADELNFIKNFWRAEPSCMAQNCTADCNPTTAHCGRGP